MRFIHCAFSTNDYMAMPLGVVIAGVLDYLADDAVAELHVLTAGLTKDNKERLEHVVRLRCSVSRVHRLTLHQIGEEAFAELPEIGRLSREAYFRLLLPSLLPDLDRVLYLDSDLIVRRDVSELMSLDLDQSIAAGVRQSTIPRLGHEEGLGYCWEAEGLDPDQPYINSGVLLLRLDRWREDRIAEKACSFLKRHVSQLRWADQDAINAVTAGRLHLLPREWNVLSGLARSDDVQAVEGEEKATILHFCGDYKPWGPDAFTHGARKLYSRKLRESGWFGSNGGHSLWLANWYATALRAYLQRGLKKVLSRS